MLRQTYMHPFLACIVGHIRAWSPLGHILQILATYMSLSITAHLTGFLLIFLKDFFITVYHLEPDHLQCFTHATFPRVGRGCYVVMYGNNLITNDWICLIDVIIISYYITYYVDCLSYVRICSLSPPTQPRSCKIKISSETNSMYVCMYICLSICPSLYLMHFKSDLGVWCINAAGSARVFMILTKVKTKTKPNQTTTKNIALGLANFWATVTC